MDLPAILNGGDKTQPPPTPRAREEVDLERALHEPDPRPMAEHRLRVGIVPVRTRRQHDLAGSAPSATTRARQRVFGGQHAMVEHQINPGPGRQGGQRLEQFERLDRRCAVTGGHCDIRVEI